MEVQFFGISGVKLFIPRHIGDEQGYFAETFHADIFARHVGEFTFVQETSR